jgi:phosphoserine aminotransferase
MPAIAHSPLAAVTRTLSGRIFNFSAGPSALPEEVLAQVQQDVMNIDSSGIGILEHSHRGSVVDRVFSEAEQDIRAIAKVPSTHKVLFMTGGASASNYLLPMNFMPTGATADYLVTGHWANQTWLQAQKFSGKPTFGAAHLAVDTKDKAHSYIPAAAQLRFSAKPAYVHYCSNNTLEGTQWHRIPEAPAGVPLACDACSDIYSRPVDVSRFALLYAGAQKNLGAAGVTVSIIREDFAQSGSREIADLLQYRTYIPDYSRPNTPPVFAVYVTGLMAKWILKNGGLPAMQKHNEAKAKLIYDVLDASRFYTPHAEKSARSLMNMTFRLPSESLTDAFVKEALAAGMDNLRGHRNVGGIRVSMYNAMPLAGATALASFMREFERTHG